MAPPLPTKTVSPRRQVAPWGRNHCPCGPIEHHHPRAAHLSRRRPQEGSRQGSVLVSSSAPPPRANCSVPSTQLNKEARAGRAGPDALCLEQLRIGALTQPSGHPGLPPRAFEGITQTEYLRKPKIFTAKRCAGRAGPAPWIKPRLPGTRRQRQWACGGKGPGVHRQNP